MENPIRNGTFIGNNIILKNKGKTPASKIATQYYITTDADKVNRHGLKWFEENLGGFGSVSFIAPDATEIEPGFRDLSPAVEYYYFEAISSYEGLKRHKKYWTYIRKIFYVDKEYNKIYAVDTYGDWDRNEDFNLPTVSTQEQVVAKLEEVKSKKIVNKK